MDRRTAYAGALGASQDILYAGRHAMVGLGYALQDLMGSGVQIFGSACTPTTPTATLAVVIAPGRIYSVQALEATTWSSLAADTTDTLVKQGINLAATTLSGFVAPGTSGQSINYLIEGQYQDVDSDNAVIAYFNATTPSQPFSGPGDAGTSQPRTRHGAFALQIKAGTAATTGSQTTPAADSGWSPMYVVTVANGQTTIVSGNIAVSTGIPQMSGSFIATLTGYASPPTLTINYRVANGICTLSAPTGVTATSNSIAMTLGSLPSQCIPQSFGAQAVPCMVTDVASAIMGGAFLTGGSATIGFGVASTSVVTNRLSFPIANFTASGLKGLPTGFSLSYPVY